MASECAEVETTRPFRSVKEAVAVFGERCRTGNANSHKTSSCAKLDIIRSQINSLPPPKPVYSANSSPPSLSSAFRFVHERDDELVVLNTLKKLEAELFETKRELKLLKEMQSETKVEVDALCLQLQKRMSTLPQALSLGRMEDDFGGRGKMKMGKRKPIIPLIADIFPKNKGSSDLRNSYYSPSFYSVLS